jgi:hypothetical protein
LIIGGPDEYYMSWACLVLHVAHRLVVGAPANGYTQAAAID